MADNKNPQIETITPPLNTPATTQNRAWGTVTILEEGTGYRINRIELKPGNAMSYQMHYHRSEHWIVVSGTARVLCDGTETMIIQNQSTYVPRGVAHRVENPGVIPLVMIEVQNGEYLGEDDIIRFDDAEENDSKSPRRPAPKVNLL